MTTLFMKQFLNDDKPVENIYIASHNDDKLKATYDAYQHQYPNKIINVIGINVPSNINEQPINDETVIGCNNRMKNLLSYLNENNIPWTQCVSIENGLFDNKDAHIISITDKNTNKSTSNLIDTFTIVPQIYVDMCAESNYTIPIGKIIERETGIPCNNWHQHFGKYTRIETMTKSIKGLIAH